MIHWLSPLAVAMRPSSEVANLRVTSGRPSRRRLRKPALISAASSAQSPVSTSRPGRAQPPEALAGDTRIGILEGDDHSPHAGGDQRIDAGRSPAPVATGFETDIGDGAASRFARPAKRLGLAMRPAAGLGPAASDDPAVLYDDTTDRRVRPDGAEPATSKRQRRAHRVEVEASIAGRNRHRPQSPSAAIRPTKSPKSLASRKLR